MRGRRIDNPPQRRRNLPHSLLKGTSYPANPAILCHKKIPRVCYKTKSIAQRIISLGCATGEWAYLSGSDPPNALTSNGASILLAKTPLGVGLLMIFELCSLYLSANSRILFTRASRSAARSFSDAEGIERSGGPE